MIARAELLNRDDEPREDHFVHLNGATWADYVRLLEIRGDRSAPRITYIEGLLEIMSPAGTHEEIKSYTSAVWWKRSAWSAISTSRPSAHGH